jgi:hypothetical protein
MFSQYSRAAVATASVKAALGQERAEVAVVDNERFQRVDGRGREHCIHHAIVPAPLLRVMQNGGMDYGQKF